MWMTNGRVCSCSNFTVPEEWLQCCDALPYNLEMFLYILFHYLIVHLKGFKKFSNVSVISFVLHQLPYGYV